MKKQSSWQIISRGCLLGAGIFSLLLASSGCGGREGLAPVSGRLTFNCKPIEGVEIVFTPLDQPLTRPSAGACDADGNYTLMFTNTEPGATIGKNRVSIIQADSPEGNASDPKALRVPAKYGDESTLEYEVKPGRNTNVDFDLAIP